MTKNLEQLKRKRSISILALNRMREFIDGIGTEVNSVSIFEIQIRLDKLSNISEQFEACQSEIEVLSNLAQKETDIRVEFEGNYFALHAKIQKLINDLKKGELNSDKPKAELESLSQIGVPYTNLPMMKLQPFCGEYDAWLEFRDSFVALVGKNSALSDIQKFYHLKSCLQKEGLETIKAIPISEANYKVAWQRLIDRYEKGHLISKKLVNSILNFSRLQKESSRGLRDLYNCIQNNLESLKNLGAQVQHWDLLLIPIVSAKLDTVTRRAWEKLSTTKKEVSIQNLLQLINERCEVLEAFEDDKTTVNSSSHTKSSLTKQKGSHCFHIQSVKIKCKICEGDHHIFRCDSFLKLNVDERIQIVKQKGLCLNCLKPSHMVNQCKSTKCKRCGKSHNTLLHRQIQINVEPQHNPQITESPPVQTNLTQSNRNYELQNQVILPTAVVFVQDSKGNLHRCRALLDNGAMSNFITKEFCSKLDLKQKTFNCSISGVGHVVQKTQHSTNINFESNSGVPFQAQCIVLDKITSHLPMYSFDKSKLEIPKDISLADPDFNKSAPINLLLGASIFWDILESDRTCIPRTGLMLQKTKLGWVVGGRSIKTMRNPPTGRNRVDCLSINQESVEQQLRKFWEIEEVNTQKPMSADDIYCEEFFCKTHERGKDGRFIVKVPFKSTVNELGNSREQALKRFKFLENRLNKNKELHTEYCKIINEYQIMGHLKQIHEEDADSERANYYIPHHAIIRKDSLTTKTRVVFDASMKSSSGLSLNDVQHIGPSIQNEIFSTLINFRLHKFIISGDISKMYRMVWLHPDHKPFHRIYWRNNPSEPLNCFELQTLTFGTASAPFLAIRCLHQLAIENEQLHPRASKIIKNNFYVDDLIFGSETISELIQLQHEITSILGSAGFHLRKWLSNSNEIYSQLELNPELECSTLEFGDKNKTLGLTWDSKNDEILYKGIKCQDNQSVTKRTVLSELAKIFDPLGLLGPVLIVGKLIMQNLWKLQITWDEQIPPELSNQWLSFRKEIADIRLIKVERRVLIDDYSSVELHGFCDASEKAYGACIFLKSKNSKGQSQTKLLCSKSRIAPLKSVSLPRLELCGALLLARLIHKVLDKFELNVYNVYCWSDSTITLAWIRNDPQRWKTFVANRVAEIQTLTKAENWNHISSSNNPCDTLSRGTTVAQLMNDQLWWSGPPCINGPLEQSPTIQLEEIPEQRALVCVNEISPEVEIVQKYSSWERVVRLTAYCIRFKVNCQVTAENRSIGELTVEELRSSSNLILRLMQQQSFPEEYRNLKAGKSLDGRSRLLSLNPFIDEEGLIRVGGRLAKGEFKYDTKHPVILDPKHRSTKLLTKQVHFDNFHCGPTMTLSILRQKYWPLNGRNLVKGVARECMVCFLAKPKANQYIMGQLPKVRVQPSFPFENVGVDYAGPILIKDRITRNYKTVKSYICLFVCLATKAIHLECVTDLTTEAFLACLSRFISRRGKPSTIHSDNGKNFVGANSEIRRFYNFIEENKQSIQKFLVKKEIRWRFIPARSPTFGGIWEAGIKSVKSHLFRVMKNTKFHFEELCTVLYQIEALLNSRPLTPMSSDPTDLTPITPGHFLIGRSFTDQPETSSTSVPASRRRRYENYRLLLEQFWARWSREYITELQIRTKWRTTPTNQGSIEVGKIVLVKDEGSTPFNWPLGRITEVHPGSDGTIRVVSVKLRDSIVKRGVNKICVLPED